MSDVRDEMEEGELSSDGSVEGGLGEYIPLERPVNPKPHFQNKSDTQDYDSDNDHQSPGEESDSDSDTEKPVVKTARVGGDRRGALVVDDGGGETFQRMAQAFQESRDQQGLNKKRKNNVWGSIMQEENIAESIAGFGVGRQLKDLKSDRGAETYDFTLIAKEREAEREKELLKERSEKKSDLDSDMDTYWSTKPDDQTEECIQDSETHNDHEVPKDTKRGLKRGIKERLGQKRVTMDQFKNEKLPPPGKPRQIVDIAEIALVEGTDEEFAEEVADKLKEEKEEMMVELVKCLGRRVVWELFKETQKIEREGGMVINNGARRRTPGGVLFHLLRKTENTELKAKAQQFFNNVQKNDKRKILQAKKSRQKDFDKEMEEFLSARKEMQKKAEEDEVIEEDVDEDNAEELAPLPNVLSMIANSIGSKSSLASGEAMDSRKTTVTRVSSFKEPEAPPNSVERQDRLSPITKEERALLDYDDDDFLTLNDTDNIDLL